jgi:hypothetical protein
LSSRTSWPSGVRLINVSKAKEGDIRVFKSVSIGRLFILG